MSNKFSTIADTFQSGISRLAVHRLLWIISTWENMFTLSTDWLHQFQNI